MVMCRSATQAVGAAELSGRTASDAPWDDETGEIMEMSAALSFALILASLSFVVLVACVVPIAFQARNRLNRPHAIGPSRYTRFADRNR